MEENIENQTLQTDVVLEDFDKTLTEVDKDTLSDDEIANKKVDFYKNLLKTERTKNKNLPKKETESKGPDIEKRLSEQEQKVELRMSGYSVDEIREIDAIARGKNIPLSEAEKSPFVQAAIKQIRAENKSKEAVLEPGNSNVMVGEKTASAVLSDTKATPADKQAAMEAMRQKSLRN